MDKLRVSCRGFQLAPSATQYGFSLVELMVGMVIALIGILVMAQIFALSEGQKRTTTTGTDAQVNGLLASFMIERDLRMAGYGIMGLGCATINAYNQNRSPQNFSFSGLPVRIVTEATGNDRIEIRYSTSAYGGMPATLQEPMPNSSANIRVNNGIGFQQGNMVIISQPPNDCAMVQLSQDGQQLGMANLTGPGTQWDLQHNPGGIYIFNPSGGQNVIFPVGGYGTGAKVTNFGTMANRAYYISNNKLVMEDLNQPVGPGNPVDLVSGIVGLRAYYGLDTNSDGNLDLPFVNATAVPASETAIVAVRLALVARSGLWERDEVSPASITLWNGGPTFDIPSNGEARHYRYKIYQTTVPIRNAIWNN
ncbi:MAG: PilW family protein [Pseudomonadota bacterium]